MFSGKHVTVIIPALNERDSIGHVLKDIPECVDRVLVVDNGSFDGTAGVARELGAEVVVEQCRGYGAACLKGIQNARETDIIAFLDADYSDYPADLGMLIKVVAEDEAELAIGCRSRTIASALPVHQRWGNWIACVLIRLLYGYHYRDLGPMRCISRQHLAELKMQDLNYGWTTEMQLKASRLGIRVMEIPVRYRQRIGKSKISGTFKGSVMAGFKIFYWTFRLMFYSRPMTGR